MAHATQTRQRTRAEMQAFIRDRAHEAAEQGNGSPDEDAPVSFSLRRFAG